ncbi:MAG: hypothetical protein PHV18_09770 [Lachnospiraceae bacterium]|nr:hypothetical protein [Lachnospiraceae bacterium]
MKKRMIALILLICISCSLSGCIYSHNYDENGDEMNESEVNEKIDTIIDDLENQIY